MPLVPMRSALNQRMPFSERMTNRVIGSSGGLPLKEFPSGQDGTATRKPLVAPDHDELFSRCF
jgi:hypothetical protein